MSTPANPSGTQDTRAFQREDDALLGWGTPRGQKNKLTGGTRRGGGAEYTEGPLGGHTRSRVATYDSASTLGLPRYGSRSCNCV